MSIQIYYASQGGTAESFAKILLEEGLHKSLNVKIFNIKDFNENNISDSSVLVFLVATHYEGGCPDDADNFVLWMKDNSPKNFLENKQFCIFGLGNSNYDNFNQFSTDLFKFCISQKMKL